jgi:hypothetical protein
VAAKIGAWVNKYVGGVLAVLTDLWICSYPLIAVIVLIVLVFWSPQGPELTSDLNEKLLAVKPAGADHPLAFALTVFAVGYCTLAMFFASVAALHKRHTTSAIPYWLAWFCMISAGGIVFGRGAALYLVLATVLSFFAMPLFLPKGTGVIHLRLGGYAPRANVILLIAGAIVVALVIAFPVLFTRSVTTWPVVYTAFGFWTLIGTLVAIAFPRRFRGGRSWWLGPLAWIALCSIWNDNHTLRALTPGAQPATPVPMMSAPLVQSWLGTHCTPAQQPCKVRFVAAQGGGQRAAYWTQAVLHALNAHENFDHSVFAFSGVSGGTLGGVSYYVARSTQRTGWEDRVKSATSQDNLAPIIGALVTREVIQALSPVAFSALDRGHIYDDGLEQTWREKFPDGNDGAGMSNAFPQPWWDAPAMFLNSTDAESGERFVNSSLLLKRNESLDAFYAADPGAPFLRNPMSTSTAAHLSSRFSFVNPHATVKYRPPNDDKIWARLVDGGYNDNNGLVTILEVMKSFLVACGKCSTVQLELVYIGNDPTGEQDLDRTPADTATPAPAPTDSPRRGLWELVTPPLAKLHAIDNADVTGERARIREFATDAKQNTGNPLTFHVVSLNRMIEMYNAANVPARPPDWCHDYATWKVALGWWLSQHSLNQMDYLLDPKFATLANGRTLLDMTNPPEHAPRARSCTDPRA